MAECVEGKNVYDELQAKRLTQKRAEGPVTLQASGGSGGVESVWRNLQDTHTSVSTARVSAKGKAGKPGGAAWHKEFQKELDKRRLRYRRVEQREFFQFGPGSPYLSVHRWVYPVGVVGCELTVEVSSVDADVPGLPGPDELAKWDAKINFANGTFEVLGHQGKLISSSTGHPCVGLLDYPEKVMHTQVVEESPEEPECLE